MASMKWSNLIFYFLLLTSVSAEVKSPLGKKFVSYRAASVEDELRDEIIRLQVENKALRRKLPGVPVLSVAHGGSGGGSVSSGAAEDYDKTSVMRLILSRGGWLSIFMASLSLTSVVMSEFEHTLEKHIELAYFVPLLIGHGGNAGGQTVGTILGAMAGGQIVQSDWCWVVTKECIAGLGAGTLTSIATIPLLRIMKISRHVSLTILATMPILTVMSSGLAAALPFAVRICGGNPEVIAAPAMTTLVDVGGLLAYFLIAQIVFKAFGIAM